MPASEARKKTLYFFFFSTIVIAALILFPAFKDWVRDSLATRFDLVVGDNDALSASTGNSASMTSTYVGLVLILLKIARVLLSMALVIATVRFLMYIVTKTIYRNATHGEISSLLKTVLSVIVYIVAFFIIFQSVFPDVQLTALFTGSTIVGIVVGLALQDTLGNLFAGLALQADQSFQVGDVISVQNQKTGVVESVSWRGVKIRTFQNKLLVLSNSVLGKEAIEVAPKDNLNARVVFFNTVYSASPARTAQVVRDAVRLAENVSPKMRPVVRIRDLGANGLDWEVKYWLDDYIKQHDTDALIRRNIWYAFQREKIEFAYPTHTIHFEQKVDEIPIEEKVNIRTERLNGVPIFAPLSDEETGRLAKAARSRVYAPEETIVRHGQEGNSMFVIVRGKVNVQIPDGLQQKVVSTLKENDFFGEMSLLTGEKRTASVVAVEETEVLRIEKSALKPILESNPDLVHSISEHIAKRRLGLEAAAESADGDAKQKATGVIRSIRKFFGLR